MEEKVKEVAFVADNSVVDIIALPLHEKRLSFSHQQVQICK
jgi:hypothetical protein